MSVEIRVYPNKGNEGEYEKLFCDPGKTLEDWLYKTVPAYHPRPAPLFTAKLNNCDFRYRDWPSKILSDGDLVECYIEPKEPMTIFLVAIAVIGAAAAIYYANQPLPDTYNSTTPTGSSIYDANAQGNRTKLMGVVPELLGCHKIYPDYLNAPRKVYAGKKEYFYAMLSLSVGEIDLDKDDIYVGNTSIRSLGDDVEYKIFRPGENVASHPAYLSVYDSPEVGGFDLLGPRNVYYYEKPDVNSYLSVYIYDDFRTVVQQRYVVEDDDGKNTFKVQYRYMDGLEAGTIIEAFDNNGIAYGYYELRLIVTHEENGYTKFLHQFHKLDPITLNATTEAPFKHLPKGFVDFNYRVIKQGGAGDKVGPYQAVPDNLTTKKIYLDFRFPAGLCFVRDNGSLASRTVALDIWIDDGNSVYIARRINYRNATVDELAYTEEVNFNSAVNPKVFVTRVTQDMNDIQYKDEVVWSGLRSELPSVSQYEGITTLAIKVLGTNVLSSASENKINCIPTRKLRRFTDSGGFDFGPTRDISAAVLYICNSAGFSDDQIDLDELWRLHKVWKTRGDEFNAVFDNESTLWDVLKRVLAVGFATPTLDFGMLVPVRDEPREHLNYMYQPDNILPKTWKAEATLIDESEPDGVEVEYFSSETWKPETYLCTLPGEEGLNPEKVRAYGITDLNKAFQFGMRKRSELRYRRVKHTFSTEMDGMNSRYLSYDALSIDIPGFGQSGRVESIDGKTITVNQDLEWGQGAHFIGIRRPDGTMFGPVECEQGSSTNEVVLSQVLGFTPNLAGTQEPPLFMFSNSADTLCERILITDIEPQGTEKVRLKGVVYDDRVFEYDDALVT